MKSDPIPQALISSALLCEKQWRGSRSVQAILPLNLNVFILLRPLCLPLRPLFSIFYGLLTVLLPWNNKHVSWGGNRCRGPTQRTNYITRKDRMKGSPVTHAHTPLKHGWLVLKVGKSVRDVKVVVYLFLPLSLFSFLAFISFSVLCLTFFSIDKLLQNGHLWKSHASDTLRHFQLIMQPIESDITHGSHYGACVKLPGFVTIGRQHWQILFLWGRAITRSPVGVDSTHSFKLNKCKICDGKKHNAIQRITAIFTVSPVELNWFRTESSSLKKPPQTFLNR